MDISRSAPRRHPPGAYPKLDAWWGKRAATRSTGSTGMSPIVARSRDVVFTFLAERYERRSVIITSNLVFSEWDRLFKDPMTTAAAIERLVHHSGILEMTGTSIWMERISDRCARCIVQRWLDHSSSPLSERSPRFTPAIFAGTATTNSS